MGATIATCLTFFVIALAFVADLTGFALPLIGLSGDLVGDFAGDLGVKGVTVFVLTPFLGVAVFLGDLTVEVLVFFTEEPDASVLFLFAVETCNKTYVR